MAVLGASHHSSVFSLFPTYKLCFRGRESKEKAVEEKKKKRTEDITASLQACLDGQCFFEACTDGIDDLSDTTFCVDSVDSLQKRKCYFFFSDNKPWLTKELINEEKKIFFFTSVSGDKKAVSEEVRTEFAKFKSTHKSKIEE